MIGRLSGELTTHNRERQKLGKLEREALAMGCFELMPDEVTAIAIIGDSGPARRPRQAAGTTTRPAYLTACAKETKLHLTRLRCFVEDRTH